MNTTDELPYENCQAAGLLGKQVAQLKIAEQELMQNCRTYINENPIASLGMALGAGFVISQLLRCRKTVCLIVDKK